MTKPNGKQKSWVVWKKRKAEVEEFSKLITNLREEHDIKSRCCELCGKIHAKAFYSSIFLIVIHHNTEFETHNLYLICLRKLPFLKRKKSRIFESLKGLCFKVQCEEFSISMQLSQCKTTTPFKAQKLLGNQQLKKKKRNSIAKS